MTVHAGFAYRDLSFWERFFGLFQKKHCCTDSMYVLHVWNYARDNWDYVRSTCAEYGIDMGVVADFSVLPRIHMAEEKYISEVINIILVLNAMAAMPLAAANNYKREVEERENYIRSMTGESFELLGNLNTCMEKLRLTLAVKEHLLEEKRATDRDNAALSAYLTANYDLRKLFNEEAKETPIQTFLRLAKEASVSDAEHE